MIRAKNIIPFIFQSLNSLYIATGHCPSPWMRNNAAGVTEGGSNTLIIFMPIRPEYYLLLRAILSLATDIYLSCKALRESGDLMELKLPVKQLLRNSKKFYPIRSFFTHLDEVLAKPNKHGITGAHKTNCGIEYTDTAKECVHLVFKGDEIHFSHKHNVKEVDVGKKAFNGIFESARLVYAEITSHKIHAENRHYLPADSIYPPY